MAVSAVADRRGFDLHDASDLNLILTGEQEARHLGVNVSRVKIVVYVAASLLTGLAVSLSGAIGYVGLLTPHVMRMLFGTDYRVLIPDVGDRRRDHHRAGGFAGAHRRRADGIAGGRDDGDCRRSRVYLLDAPEACDERRRRISGGSSRRKAAPQLRMTRRLRLRVEQVSFAYSATRPFGAHIYAGPGEL